MGCTRLTLTPFHQTKQYSNINASCKLLSGGAARNEWKQSPSLTGWCSPWYPLQSAEGVSFDLQHLFKKAVENTLPGTNISHQWEFGNSSSQLLDGICSQDGRFPIQGDPKVLDSSQVQSWGISTLREGSGAGKPRILRSFGGSQYGRVPPMGLRGYCCLAPLFSMRDICF